MYLQLILFFLFIISPVYADVTDGLVGWWKFDESGGATAVDSSGVGNDATLVNSPTRLQGKKAGALSFNGSSNYVTRNSVTPASASRTVCFWFKTNALGTQKGIMGVGNVTTENDPLWLIVTKATNVFSIYHAAGYHDGTTTLSTGVWYFGAYTYNSSNGAVKLYLNSNQEYSGTLGESGKSTYLYLGIGYPTYFNGVIDDVRIYNRDLTAAEINEVYMSGVARVQLRGSGRIGSMQIKR